MHVLHQVVKLHILERFNPKKLIALDHDAKRLLRVSENLERLVLDQHNVEIMTADATTWQAKKLSIVSCWMHLVLQQV
jgi:16S rRNA C967 or C1407 C5-methylase (RsmB/RsmF family)